MEQKVMRMNQARKLTKNELWKQFRKLGFIDGKHHSPNHEGVDGKHAGKPCAVIGSGFSASGVNFDMLKNMVTIAVNHVIDSYPTADYLIFQDHRFLKKNKTDLKKYPGTMVVANSNPIVKISNEFSNIVTFIPLSNNEPVATSITQGLYARKSTGLCALNLALVLGCNPIYLLGCDMPKNWRDTVKIEDGIHFDKSYAGSVDTIKSLEGYEATLDMYEPFGKYQDRIINVCENGIIKYFRQYSVEQFNKKLKENL